MSVCAEVSKERSRNTKENKELLLYSLDMGSRANPIATLGNSSSVLSSIGGFLRFGVGMEMTTET